MEPGGQRRVERSDGTMPTRLEDAVWLVCVEDENDPLPSASARHPSVTALLGTLRDKAREVLVEDMGDDTAVIEWNGRSAMVAYSRRTNAMDVMDGFDALAQFPEQRGAILAAVRNACKTGCAQTVTLP